MIKQEYIVAGYRLGANIEQAQLDKAEADVKSAYILPYFINEPDFTAAPFRGCVMELAYIYVMRERAFATRVGGVNKTSDRSTTDIDLSIHNQIAAMRLRQVRALQERSGETTDICMIYFINRIRH